MKRAKSILSAFVLTCALCSTTFAGHIASGKATGHIASGKATGHIASGKASGHIASASGHIASARATGNTFDLDLFLVRLLMTMPWF